MLSDCVGRVLKTTAAANLQDLCLGSTHFLLGSLGESSSLGGACGSHLQNGATPSLDLYGLPDVEESPVGDLAASHG